MRRVEMISPKNVEPAAVEADDLLTNPAWWVPDDPTVLYNPRFLFPPGELLARARSFRASSGSGVPRESRRDMDDDALARVFGLVGIGVRGDRVPATGGLGDGGEENAAASEQQPGDILAVCAGDEISERERREAEEEAALDAGWNDLVRSIDELLMDDDADYAKEDVPVEAGQDGRVANADVDNGVQLHEGSGSSGGLAPQQPAVERPQRKARRYAAKKKKAHG
ncbi:hypothetical protein ACP70R_011337 [Stipagrostis hirtigluma subsp. patula]